MFIKPDSTSITATRCHDIVSRMNEHVRQSGRQGNLTQAAEGLMRRAWTVAEIEQMVAAGIIPEKERFELIGGEVVPLSPKGARHESVKVALAIYWYQRLRNDLLMAQETTFRLDEHSFLEPDFVFFTRETGVAGLAPPTCLLAVEVADTSLSYDLGRKPRIYCEVQVPEVWVINANTLETTRHRTPSKDAYADIDVIPPTEPLIPAFAPALTVRLADLELA